MTDISNESVQKFREMIEAIADSMTPEEEAMATITDLEERRRADKKKDTGEHLTDILVEIFTGQAAERAAYKAKISELRQQLAAHRETPQ